MLVCCYVILRCVCFTEPFPLYAVVIIVLGSLLLIVLLAAMLVYRFSHTIYYL